MEYSFNLGMFNGVFAVPDSIVDKYIKIATGDSLKVLLYCLRHSGQGLSAGEISRATGVPSGNVTSSLEFWQQQAAFTDASAETTDSAALLDKLNKLNTKKATALLERDYDFSPKEISDTIKGSDDIEYLFKRGEELYGRPLKHNEQKALAVIIEDVGMKPEVALMLMEYCFSIAKTTPSYIKKTAKNWIEQGIDSILLAEAEIKRLKEYYSAEGELKRLLKVKDIPESRKPLLRKWMYEYNQSNEIIYAAYQKALEKTGKLEYTYMDRILTGLHETGTSGLSQSKPDGKKVQDKPSAAPSFSLDELDRQIMEEYKNRSS